MTTTPLTRNQMLNVLSKLSVGDSAHDFPDFKINGASTNSYNLKNAFYTGARIDEKDVRHVETFKNIYCDGLPKFKESGMSPTCITPVSMSSELSEVSMLNTVIQSGSGPRDVDGIYMMAPRGISEIPYPKYSEQYYNAIQEKINNGHTDYQLRTINNILYQVKGRVTVKEKIVTGKQRVDGITLFTDLGIISSDNPDKDIAVIIDAVSIGFIDSLQTEPSTPPTRRPTVYYVYTNEVENDPADKTPVLNPESYKTTFTSPLTPHSGIPIIPLVQKPNTKDFYKYGFNEEKAIPIFIDSSDGKHKELLPSEAFYTDYTFKLSGLQEKSNGLSETLNVRLDVLPQSVYDIQDNADDSKNQPASNQNAISSILKKITDISKKTINDIVNRKSTFDNSKESIFTINSGFQRKRSGDWLQVLACKNLFSRQLCRTTLYQSPPEKRVKAKVTISENCSSSPINYLTDVYFVTHDQIALAFALLNGINCIFTHADTAACYSFIVANPELIKAQKLKNITDILTLGDEDIYKEKYNEESELYELLGSTESSSGYLNQYATKNREYIDNMNREYTELNNILFDEGGILKNEIQPIDFIEKFKLLSKIMFQYSVFTGIFPNLSETFKNYKDAKQNLIDEIFLFALENSDISIDNIESKEDKVRKLIILQSTLNNLYSSLLVVKKFAIRNDTGEIIINNMNIDNKLERITEYKSIDSWKWEIRQTRNTRLVSFLERVREEVAGIGRGEKSKKEKQDKNAFLYMLCNIPTDITGGIVKIFINLYQIIQSNPVQFDTAFIISDREKKQEFALFMKNLCIELFITLGGIGISETTTEDIERLISPITYASPAVGGNKNYIQFGGAITISELKSNQEIIKVFINDYFKNTIFKGDLSDYILINSYMDYLFGENTDAEYDNSSSIKDGVEETKSFEPTPPSVSIEEVSEKQMIPSYNFNYEIIYKTLLSNLLLTNYLNDQTELSVDISNIDELISKDELNIDIIIYSVLKKIPITTTGINVLEKNYCFHPLTPAFVMCIAAYNFSLNNDVDASFDCELFKQYVAFLYKICEKTNNLCDIADVNNQFKAYLIGLALRDLFFATDLELFGKVLNLQLGSTLNTVCQMNNILSNNVIGTPVNYYIDSENILLTNDVFREFITDINPRMIFSEINLSEDISKLEGKVPPTDLKLLKFLEEMPVKSSDGVRDVNGFILWMMKNVYKKIMETSRIDILTTEHVDIEGAPIEQVTAQDTDTEEPPSEQATAQETDTQEPTSEQATAQNTDNEEPTSEQATPQETDTQEPTSEQATAQDTDNEEPPSEEATAQDTDTEEPPSEQAIVDRKRKREPEQSPTSVTELEEVIREQEIMDRKRKREPPQSPTSVSELYGSPITKRRRVVPRRIDKSESWATAIGGKKTIKKNKKRHDNKVKQIKDKEMKKRKTRINKNKRAINKKNTRRNN